MPALDVHDAISNPSTRRRLVAFATARLGAPTDAEDCVQEALLLASRHAPSFAGRATPETWLFRVVLNACRMHRRARRRLRRGEGAVHVPLEDVTVTPGDATPDPETAYLRRESLAVVEDALSQLPAEDRTLFTRLLSEPTAQDALGAALGLSRQAVKSRVFRVRRHLVRRLSAAGTIRP